MPEKPRAMTLIELIIALVVFSLVVWGAVSIEVFSRNQLIQSQRRAKLQNEIMQLFVHIKKQPLATINTATTAGFTDSVYIWANVANFVSSVLFYIDRGPSGGPGDGIRSNSPPDRWIGYAHTGSEWLFGDQRFQVWYMPNENNTSEFWVLFNGFFEHDTIASRITNFIPTQPVGANYVNLSVTACWDTSTAASVDVCNNGGSSDNPSVSMRTTILLPSVVTR